MIGLDEAISVKLFLAAVVRRGGPAVLVCLAPLLAFAGAGNAKPTPAATCSSFGSKFVRTYNATAAKQGNPVRMLAACCGKPTKAGLNPCHIIVTLAGTHSTGCEFVNLNKKGEPVGPGKHETCG